MLHDTDRRRAATNFLDTAVQDLVNMARAISCQNTAHSGGQQVEGIFVDSNMSRVLYSNLSLIGTA